jgi:hypothetical protein
MALIGYEIEKNKIEEKIREVQAALGTAVTPSAGQVVKKRRKLSAAARRKIALAQKRRWAELKKNAGKK